MFVGIKGRTAKAAGISAGTFGSFVITTNGHTLAFGVNASGQLGFTATVRSSFAMHFKKRMAKAFSLVHSLLKI